MRLVDVTTAMTGEAKVSAVRGAARARTPLPRPGGIAARTLRATLLDIRTPETFGANSLSSVEGTEMFWQHPRTSMTDHRPTT